MEQMDTDDILTFVDRVFSLITGETKWTGLNQGSEFIPFFEYSIEHGVVELRDRRWYF
jgi:hypothetical protein